MSPRGLRSRLATAKPVPFSELVAVEATPAEARRIGVGLLDEAIRLARAGDTEHAEAAIRDACVWLDLSLGEATR